MTRFHFQVLGFLVLAVCTLLLEGTVWLKGPTLHVTDIGQGDGIVISHGGYQIVVDGGPDLTLLSQLGNILPHFDRRVDLLVLSHPNLDHIAAFPEILRRYRVSTVLLTGADFPLPRYDEFLILLAEKKIRVIIADPSQDLQVGNLFVDILWPPPDFFGKSVKGDVNDTSIAMKVSVPNGKSVLLTGDMEEKEERWILQAGKNVKADILKVAHHGSLSSSSTGFLLAVDPDLAVISVGKENRYGHPHPVVMKRFETLGIPVRTTAQEGTVEIPL